MSEVFKQLPEYPQVPESFDELKVAYDNFRIVCEIPDTVEYDTLGDSWGPHDRTPKNADGGLVGIRYTTHEAQLVGVSAKQLTELKIMGAIAFSDVYTHIVHPSARAFTFDAYRVAFTNSPKK